ncbi:hypothetical protein Y10_30240 [Neptunitalea sp. Y10]|uniref:Signal transduction histidine kinase internal region domain-containing protein n=2 Tax=Neptunitalea lumnitzerae TaxID=2965509 RepID=A0ABQ5MMN8_9FLAO|nr:hypothetical protein Y10_30240 [Neptunitalea sp. Y10]
MVFSFLGYSQEAKTKNKDKSKTTFNLKGVVKDFESKKPIRDIEVYVVGGGLPEYTDELGKFSIRAKVGDELVITGLDIVPVYHTLTSNDDVEVLVRGFYVPNNSKEVKQMHTSLLDSAKMYKKTSIEKSLTAIEKSLRLLQLDEYEKERMASYELLGDVYMYWKQFDLAVSNYKNAIGGASNAELSLKLGKAYLKNKQYAEAKDVFTKLLDTTWKDDHSRVEVLNSLAEALVQLEEIDKSIEYRKKALDLAVKSNDELAVAISAKLGESYAAIGDNSNALGYLNGSVVIAKENSRSEFDVLKASENTADFYNANQLYDKEIEIRQENLKKMESLVANDSLVLDSISLQKMNYKIARAYISKNAFTLAIPYLKESIKQASEQKDIVVEKDATRKLSELYRTVGDFKKALESYQSYVALVDTLYRKKEQQISQANRFRNDIATKQARIKSLENDRELQRSKMALAIKNQQLTVESNHKKQLTIYLLIIGLTLLALTAYFFFRNNKQQKITNNLLALKSLRSQMNPHFIFNALNSVNHYIATNDERNANRFLSQFSSLMRSVLENSEEDVIPFSKEVELLKLYVKLEHSRFTDKFDFEFDLDETIDTDNYQIPPMLLQPYVENAIWHGLRYRDTKGLLRIQIVKNEDASIKIEILDNGIGRKQSKALKTEHQKKKTSKAMGNIDRRIQILNTMYKDIVSVMIEDIEGVETGTRVTVILKPN